jgi:acetylglutamate kinase
MHTPFKPEDIDQLLAEADELIKQIDSDAIRDMEEEHRIQFEMHAQNLKKLRAEIHEKTATQEEAEDGPYSEGMHKAILDIVSAMKNLGTNLHSSAGDLDQA